MTQKNLLAVAAIVASALFALSSCNNAPKADEQAKSSAASATGQKIAYVEVDSIMSQYEFCKEYSMVLEKKSQNIQSTLAGKQQSLQAAMAKLQQDYQSNALTQASAEQRQAAIRKQDADLQALSQRLSKEFQEETAKFNETLHDSLQHFLAVYNKDKKFTMILSKSGDNILYADKSVDITNEVIAGLNKAYKKK